MRDDRPSITAAAVAVCRTLGRLLPADAWLADDPFGIRFGGPGLVRLGQAALEHPRAGALALRAAPRARRMVLWMQVRTRFLDDELLGFVRGGGRQVLLLGAGFDCRAARFARELDESRVFEVDHPATQAKKRRVLAEADAPSARVDYVAWDFERRPVAELPARLAELGHDATTPTLTIWEGVTMYLTRAALDASVAAVRALSAPGSRFAITYFTPEGVRRMRRMSPVLRAEPFRSGFALGEIGPWLATHGFELVQDFGGDDLARRFLPARWHDVFGPERRIAVATPCAPR